MKELKNPILLALIIVVVILLLDKCTRNKINTSTPEVISSKSDTIYLPGVETVKWDTAYKKIYGNSSDEAALKSAKFILETEFNDIL